jgi:putative ABC transport system ATP-binding protein
LIQTRQLRKTYQLGDETVHALDGVDLDVEPGDYVAVMGPSGSGKSTLLNVLGCLDTPSSGGYRLGEDEVAALDDDALSALRGRHIGFVFQSFHLLPRLSALENVMLPARFAGGVDSSTESRARDLLTRLGLGDRLPHRPNQLSGGQRQRVAIARALINRPRVILADEPTGNLDSRTSKEIMHLFAELNSEGQTILMVTHEDEIAARARRVVVMRDGRILEDRRHAH